MRPRSSILAKAVGVGFLCAASVACKDSAKKSGAATTVTSNDTLRTQTDADDFGTRIVVNDTIGTRVVSLVPAATEVIFAIGRGGRLVGRTTWDNHPDSASNVPNVGDGLRPNVEVVLATKPTLVVLYASADNRAAAASFQRAGIAVLAIKVDHIADFERLTVQLGRLLATSDRARQVVDSVQSTLARVRVAVAGEPRPTVAWPLYDAPVLVVGKGSYMSELLDIAGADNVFADLALPSPEVNVEEIVKRNPQFLMTSPSSVARLRMNPKWVVVPAIRDKRLLFVDTTVVGRPTVTLGMAAVSLAKLLHPDRASSLP